MSNIVNMRPVSKISETPCEGCGNLISPGDKVWILTEEENVSILLHPNSECLLMYVKPEEGFLLSTRVIGG